MSVFTSLQLFAADKINPSVVGIPTPTADEVFQNALYLVYYSAGFVAVICIVIGAIAYTTAGASEKGVTTGKNMIFYSVIGLVVVAVAFILTRFVISRF